MMVTILFKFMQVDQRCVITLVFCCLAGKMKGLAFITDPDGYWIEILNGQNIARI